MTATVADLMIERLHAWGVRTILPAIRDDPSATVVTDGFSCREQLRQLLGVRALHGAELLVVGCPVG